MLSKTKRNRKVALIKQYILQNGSISRADAVRVFDLDIRTAGSYLEKLTRQGFCRKENSEPDGKGRPGIIYFSNVENMVFAGILIRQGMFIECVLTDLDGNILVRKNLGDSSTISKITLFNSIADTIRKITESFPDKTLGGIGIAVSRWLQPPLASYDLYNGLIKFLEKEINVNVYRTININAAAYDAANTNEQKDIIVLHAGNVLELGIIQNGMNIRNYQEHENALSHLVVNENGPRCYCGKKGCLENYVTQNVLMERLSAVSPGAAIKDIANGKEKLAEVRGELVDYIGQACLYLNQTYKPR